MNWEKVKRPTGLTIICIIWFIFGLVNVFSAFRTISQDVESLQYLSGYEIDPWFKFGVPVELALSVIVLCSGLLQIATVIGLWTGKKHSYNLALAIPIALVLVSLSSVVLYATAPSSLNLGYVAVVSAVSAVFATLWVIVFWMYLRRPRLKAFLGLASSQPQPVPVQALVEPPSASSQAASQERAKSCCRYCSRINVTDAKFCAYCGKKLRKTETQ